MLIIFLNYLKIKFVLICLCKFVRQWQNTLGPSNLLMGTLHLCVHCTVLASGPARPEGKRDTASAPPPIGAPLNFVISVKFSIRLLKAREERKLNKVIEKSVLIE